MKQGMHSSRVTLTPSGNQGESARGMWGTGLVQDIRVGLRRIVRTPGFTVVAIISIAIGVGSNSILFMVVRALGAHPPGFTDADKLVDLRLEGPHESIGTFSHGAFLKLHEVIGPKFAGMAGTTRVTVGVSDDSGRNERVPGELVAGSYFQTLGIGVQEGRSLGPTGNGDHERVVVLSDRYWRRAFQADPGVVGHTVRLSGFPHRIVGVAAPEFTGFSPKWNTELWAPVNESNWINPGEDRPAKPWNDSLMVRARLSDEVGWEEARRLVDSVAESVLAAIGSDYPAREIGVTPVPAVLVTTSAFPTFCPIRSLVVVAAILPLLIAFINLAGFLMARTEHRSAEVALLNALGAGPWRMLRSLSVETTMVALVGGGVGLLISLFPIWILADTPQLFRRPPLHDVRLDIDVILLALAVSLLAGLALGLAPTAKLILGNAFSVLGGQGSGRITRPSRIPGAVIVGQVACTVALLAGAGLFARSLLALRSVNPGFGRHPAAIAWIEPAHYQTPERLRTLYDTYYERLSAHPQVVSVGGIAAMPFEGNGTRAIPIPGPTGEPSSRSSRPQALSVTVSGDYLDVLGIDLVAGRHFDERDSANSAPVAIVSESMASLLWPDGAATGRTYRNPEDGTEVEVVGIVAEARMGAVYDPVPPVLYRPFQQDPRVHWRIVARTVADPAPVVAAMRELTAEMDHELTASDIKTMEEYLSLTQMPALLPARMLVSISLLALLLAAVGLYGVVSYSVAVRTREMGIRMSVGAGSVDLLRSALRPGLKLVALGLAIGLPLAMALGHGIRGCLYGVGPHDPLTLAAAATVVTAVAALAIYLSARRALRIDPVGAMKAG